jgi:hypothetical protein
MPDVEVTTERTAGRGRPATVYRLVEVEAEEVTPEEQPQPVVEVKTAAVKAPKRKAATKPRLSVVGTTDQPVKVTRSGAKKTTVPAKASASDPLEAALAALF